MYVCIDVCVCRSLSMYLCRCMWWRWWWLHILRIADGDHNSIPVYLRIGLLSCFTLTLLDNQLILWTSHRTFLIWRNCVLRCILVNHLIVFHSLLTSQQLRWRHWSRSILGVAKGVIARISRLRSSLKAALQIWMYPRTTAPPTLPSCSINP